MKNVVSVPGGTVNARGQRQLRSAHAHRTPCVLTHQLSSPLHIAGRADDVKVERVAEPGDVVLLEFDPSLVASRIIDAGIDRLEHQALWK